MKPRQKKAALNYLRGMTKREAMLEAGYSESMATTKTGDVFNHPEVAKFIEQKRAASASKSDVTFDWIVERLKSIAGANLGDALEFDEDNLPNINLEKLTPDLKRALNGITVQKYKQGRGKHAVPVTKINVKLNDQLRALELLMRHLGLSKEKQVVEVQHNTVDAILAGRKRAGLMKEQDDE